MTAAGRLLFILLVTLVWQSGSQQFEVISDNGAEAAPARCGLRRARPATLSFVSRRTRPATESPSRKC